MRDSIPSSPGDGGAAALAADSSTDSVTELIDLEADEPVVGGWDPPTNSPPPKHPDPILVSIFDRFAQDQLQFKMKRLLQRFSSKMKHTSKLL